MARKEQSRVRGDLYSYDVIIKYELENSKDEAVVLDISESLKELRNEIHDGDRSPYRPRDRYYLGNRDVDWELGSEGSLNEFIDRDKTTADEAVFHVPLPARRADQKPAKKVHTLHVLIKNEW